MYSTHNEGRSVVAEIFIRTLKNKTYYINIKNVYIDKLDEVVNKYNNIYSTIQMKPAYFKNNTYIDSCRKK